MLLLLFFSLQVSICVLAGDLAGRAMARFSLWRAGAPEVSLVLGYSSFSVIGYVSLPFTTSAKGIFLACVIIAVAVWARVEAVAVADPPVWIQPYLAYRANREFFFYLCGIILFAALVIGYRLPWLIHLSAGGHTVVGAPVWDDARTIGVPISLASYGYPLRSPLNVMAHLAYPLGAFQYTSGVIAWLPALPLPVILADSGVQSMYYTITALFVAGMLFRSARARALVMLAATISVSFNLWFFNPSPDTWWLNTFFGWYRHNQQFTTIGWTPFSGLVWIPNHAVAFAAVLMAGVWLFKGAALRVPLVFAVFAAMTSVDMTVMTLVSSTFFLAVRAANNLCGVLSDMCNRRMLAIAVVMSASLVLVNLETLVHEVDAPFDPLFPVTTMATYNLGLLGGQIGLWLIMMLAGVLLLRRLGFPPMWLVVLITGLSFAMIFEYHTIWAWRFSFAAHLLCGITAAWQMDQFVKCTRRWIFVIYLVILIPGTIQLGISLKDGFRYAPWKPPEQAQLIQWIVNHTQLWHRVTEYRPAEASLVSDPVFLRTGNRGGMKVFDRSLPIVGYQDTGTQMANLATALAANDFVIIPNAAQQLKEFLTTCAVERFANKTGTVFAITDGCRQILAYATVSHELQRLHQRMRLEARTRTGTVPATAPTQDLADYVSLHPEAAWLMRQRMEKLWAEGKHEEGLRALATIDEERPAIPEIDYCYAFTLHISGKDPTKAIALYSRALQNGYAEFWIRYNRGSAFLLINDKENARRDLVVARKLNPSHPGLTELLDRLSRH